MADESNIDQIDQIELLEDYGHQLSSLRTAANGPRSAGGLRAQYEMALVSSRLLLRSTKIDPENAGVVSRTDAPNDALRYFPSMLALQLYLESDTKLFNGSVYEPPLVAPANETPEAQTVRLDAEFTKMILALHGNDLRLKPPFLWSERIEFQDKYLRVYEALRHHVLLARATRTKVLITRDVEKTVLGQLLGDEQIKLAVSRLQANCNNAFALADNTAQQAIETAITATMTYANKTLFDKFMALVNALPVV